MDLSQLQRFVTTVEGGSLGKAAELLKISQPGLSKSIQQLEVDFGAKLLDRGPKGVTSTAFGAAVYLRAKRILAEWRHLENERVALIDGQAGHISIGVARGTGLLGRVIPAASAQLTNCRYAVHLTVVGGVTDELVRALRLGDLDFAVVVLDTVNGNDLEAEVLFKDRCGLFVDSSHPLARHPSVGIADLARYCWLYSNDTAPLRDALQVLAQSKGAEPRQTGIDSNSVVYLTNTLIGSEFIGLLSTDAVDEAVRAGTLVELSLDPAQSAEVSGAAIARPVGFLRRAGTTLSPVAQALREEILRRLTVPAPAPTQGANELHAGDEPALLDVSGG